MRAVVITKHGDPSVLQVQQRPDPPPPGSGQLQVAVRAAGVNFADHLAGMAAMGLLPGAGAMTVPEAAARIRESGIWGPAFW